jgi:hypothetical protein
VQVAQRLQKNAHAQFVLGLMYQRLGEHLKVLGLGPYLDLNIDLTYFSDF